MTAESIARLKITLDDVKPRVLRRIEAPLKALVGDYGECDRLARDRQAISRLSPLSREFPPALCGRLVGPEPPINRLPQEPVLGPGQIGALRYELRLDPKMHARKNERRSEAGLAWRRRA
jgi:hypothetical protein